MRNSRLAFALAFTSAFTPPLAAQEASAPTPPASPASAPASAPAQPAGAPASASTNSAPANAAPAEPKSLVKPKAAPDNCPGVEAAEYGGFGLIRDFAWLPDGSAVVYLLSTDGPAQLWMVAVPAAQEPESKPKPRRLTSLRDGALHLVPEAGSRAVFLTVPAGPGRTRILRQPLPAGPDGRVPPASEPPFGAEKPLSLETLGRAGDSLLFLTQLPDGSRHLHRAVDASGFTELATLAAGERPRLLSPRGELLTATGEPPRFKLYDPEGGKTRALPVKFPAPVKTAEPLGFGADGRLLLAADPDGGPELFSVAASGGTAAPEGSGVPLAAGSAAGRDWEIRAAPGGPVLSLASDDEIPRKLALPAGAPRLALPSPDGTRFAAIAAGPLAPGDLWLLPVDGAPLRLVSTQPADLAPACARAPERAAIPAGAGSLAGWAWRPAGEPKAAAVLVGGGDEGFAPFDGRAHYLASRGYLALRLPRADAAALNGPVREWLLAQKIPAFRLALWGEGDGADDALAAAAAAPGNWSALAAAAPRGAPAAFAQLPPLILFASKGAAGDNAREWAGRLLAGGRPFSYHEFAGEGPDWPGGCDRRAQVSLIGKFLRRRVLMRAAPKAAAATP